MGAIAVGAGIGGLAATLTLTLTLRSAGHVIALVLRARCFAGSGC